MIEETGGTIQPGFIFADEDLKKPEHDEIMLWLDTNIDRLLNQAIYPNLSEAQIDEYLETPADISKNWQQPVKSPRGEIAGFIDMIVRYERADEYDDPISKVFFLDVRTAIPSLGELIREVNTYKMYLGFEESWFYFYVVICPNDRHAGILQAQGIGFWRYDPE